jgi:hypothetical protein
MFESARLKIERADHHIRDVERLLNSFAKENVHVISCEPDAGTNRFVVTIEFSRVITSEIALTIGDAIHNLRTALDHLAWEVIGNDDGEQNRWLKFPMGVTQANFEAMCKGIKTPSVSINEMFKSFQAFPDGIGRSLYILHSLDNADKHTVLTPVVQVSTIKHVVIRDGEGDVAMTLDQISVVSLEPQSGGTSFRLAQVPDGCFVDFKNDAEVIPDIFFGDVDFVREQPILPTLAMLRDATLETIILAGM